MFVCQRLSYCILLYSCRKTSLRVIFGDCQHLLCCTLLYSCCRLSQKGILFGVCLSTPYVLHIAVFLCKLSLEGILQVSLSTPFVLYLVVFLCKPSHQRHSQVFVCQHLPCCICCTRFAWRLSSVLCPCLHGSGAITLVTV